MNEHTGTPDNDNQPKPSILDEAIINEPNRFTLRDLLLAIMRGMDETAQATMGKPLTLTVKNELGDYFVMSGSLAALGSVDALAEQGSTPHS